MIYSVDWYWYWSIVMQEMIASLALYAIVALVFSVILKLVSIKIIYHSTVSLVTKTVAELLAIGAALIAFTAVFSAFIEHMWVNLAISGVLVVLSMVTAAWVER